MTGSRGAAWAGSPAIHEVPSASTKPQTATLLRACWFRIGLALVVTVGKAEADVLEEILSF